MGEQQFRQLYKEGTAAVKEKAGEAPEQRARGFFARRCVMIGILLLIVGFLLFSLQSLSLSAPARPYNSFALLAVDDLPPLEQEGEESMPNDEGKQYDFSAHYKSQPSEKFAQRFKSLIETLEIPGQIEAVPAEVLRRELRYLVRPGQAPAQPSDLLPEQAYLLVQVSEEDARLLLEPLVQVDNVTAGKLFLGPFPYRNDEGERELVLGESRIPISRLLPNEASALQGLVIAPVPEVRANALFLVPKGDQSVGDFFNTLNTVGSSLFEEREKLETELRLHPGLSSSDYRHNTTTFAITAAGEIIFLVGGFFLFFHFFSVIARKPLAEGRPIRALFVESCRLVTGHAGLYALVVTLVLGFWLWGMFTAHFDPGTQRGVISWLREQFAGGGWPLGVAGWAYASGNILIAAAVTFVVNFLQGTVLFLSLPSLIPIASAFIVNALRGQLLGMALSPTFLGMGQSKTLHLLTILLELQGYLLAAFVSVFLPLALLKPERFGLSSRKEAYKKFALWQFRILPLIAVILLIAAAYEAFELIVLMNLLR